MTPTPKTWALFVLAVALAGAWGIGRIDPTPEAPPAVSLPSVAANDVTRIVLSTLVDRFVLEKVDGVWRMTEPLDFRAEPQLVQQVLDALAGGPTMDATIDEGNLEDYGVDDQHAKVVELFAGGDTPVVSVHVGKTATPTSAFVRISGGDTVYRAAIGPRTVFDRAPAEWRDRRILDLDPAAVVGLTLTQGTEPLTFRKADSGWTLDGGPQVDAELLDLITKGLATVRASRIHPADYDAGFATPTATATLLLADGRSHTLTLGARVEENASFVKADDRAEVYRVSPQVRRMMTQPLANLRDRSLLDFDPVKVEELRLVDGGLTVVVQPRMDGTWAIVQPANMDADQEAISRAVVALSTLRAGRIADGASFNPSGARLTVKLVNGTEQTLSFGERVKDEAGNDGVRVKVEGRATVYEIAVGALVELRRAFGRG